MDWTELKAYETADEHWPLLLRLMKMDGDGEYGEVHNKDVDYKAVLEYASLPFDVQCDLGYIGNILEAEVDEGNIYVTRSSMRQFMCEGYCIPRRPIRYLGLASENSDLLSDWFYVYLIEGWCLQEKDSRIFYTNNWIEDDLERAKKAAEHIERLSSGITDVRVEKLTCLKTTYIEKHGEYWAVTFRLDESTHRTFYFGGEDITPVGPFAVFAAVEEDFDVKCKIGEVVHGNPDDAFILVWHRLDFE